MPEFSEGHEYPQSVLQREKQTYRSTLGSKTWALAFLMGTGYKENYTYPESSYAKWACKGGWVTHTLFLFSGKKNKKIRVLILCFPSEKQKFPPFCGTKRNKNHVASTPTSLLTMTYKALHKSGPIHSPSLCQYPLTSLSGLSSWRPFCSLKKLSWLTDLAYALFPDWILSPHLFTLSLFLLNFHIIFSGRTMQREVQTCAQSYLACKSLFPNFFILLSPLIRM